MDRSGVNLLSISNGEHVVDPFPGSAVTSSGNAQQEAQDLVEIHDLNVFLGSVVLVKSVTYKNKHGEVDIWTTCSKSGPMANPITDMSSR